MQELWLFWAVAFQYGGLSLLSSNAGATSGEVQGAQKQEQTLAQDGGKVLPGWSPACTSRLLSLRPTGGYAESLGLPRRSVSLAAPNARSRGVLSSGCPTPGS